mgnify:CR=1 FL=1
MRLLYRQSIPFIISAFSVLSVVMTNQSTVAVTWFVFGSTWLLSSGTQAFSSR